MMGPAVVFVFAGFPNATGCSVKEPGEVVGALLLLAMLRTQFHLKLDLDLKDVVPGEEL
jgi:hypothetical protein